MGTSQHSGQPLHKASNTSLTQDLLERVNGQIIFIFWPTITNITFLNLMPWLKLTASSPRQTTREGSWPRVQGIQELWRAAALAVLYLHHSARELRLGGKRTGCSAQKASYSLEFPGFGGGPESELLLCWGSFCCQNQAVDTVISIGPPRVLQETLLRGWALQLSVLARAAWASSSGSRPCWACGSDNHWLSWAGWSSVCLGSSGRLSHLP